MKKTMKGFIISVLIGVIISVALSCAVSYFSNGGTDLLSTVLGTVGISVMAFSVFFGWGHTMLGMHFPNLGAMDVQHTDPSMAGKIEWDWLMTGVIDLILAFTIAFL